MEVLQIRLHLSLSWSLAQSKMSGSGTRPQNMAYQYLGTRENNKTGF